MTRIDLRPLRIAQTVLFAAQALVWAMAFYAGAFVWALT